MIDSPEASERTRETRQRRPAATGGAKIELNQAQLVIDGAELRVPGFTPPGMPPAGNNPKTRHARSPVIL
jgi:hypothetical protein